MKKHFLSTLFLSGFLISNCLAQTNQGSVMLGGSMNLNGGYSSDRSSNYSNSSYTISPTLGYFVADRVAIGSNVGFHYSFSKDNTNVNYRGAGYSVAPFVRYYKLIGEKVAVIGSGSVNYYRNTTKRLDTPESLIISHRQINFGASISPGLTYFASSKFGLEATLGSIGYSKSTSKSFQDENSYSEYSNTGFGANFGLNSFALGIYFYLNR